MVVTSARWTSNSNHRQRLTVLPLNQLFSLLTTLECRCCQHTSAYEPSLIELIPESAEILCINSGSDFPGWLDFKQIDGLSVLSVLGQASRPSLTMVASKDLNFVVAELL